MVVPRAHGPTWEDPETPGAPSPLLAFVDESMRRVGPTTVHYLLGAAVVPEDRCPEVRAGLSQLLVRRQRSLHWRDEHQTRRELIAKTIRQLTVEAVVVTGSMTDSRKQERARRLVLSHLLCWLDQREVSLVVLESRHAQRGTVTT